MVIVLLAHTAVTPAGNPVGVPMPVAPVVVMVMAGLNEVFTHNEGVLGVVAVFSGVTSIDPVALTAPQPPVNGML